MKIDALRLSPPWIVFQKMVQALFEKDPDVGVTVGEDADGPFVKLRVAKPEKAAALARMLPVGKSFGNVTCKIAVVPPNGYALPRAPEGGVELAKAAFDGNGAVAEIRRVSVGLFRDLAYVAFNREVVQFAADRLDDINGNWSGLYETIARAVCENAEGIFFCTAAATGLAAEFDQWP